MRTFALVFLASVACALILYALGVGVKTDDSAPEPRVYTSADCIAIDAGDWRRAWTVDRDHDGRQRIAEISWRFAQDLIPGLPSTGVDPRPAMAWPAPPHETPSR